MAGNDLQTVDVAVIGGGLAGLYAADQLTQAGKSVVVLEARDRLGGLTCSVPSKVYPGLVDLGGQWVAPQHDRMHALIKRFDVPFVQQFTTGDRCCLHDGKAFRGAPGTLPSMSDEDVALYQAKIDVLCEILDTIPEDPWTAPNATALDSMTAHAWICAQVPEGKVRNSLLRWPGAFFGAAPEEISALEFFHKLKSCGGPVFMGDSQTGAQSAHMMGSQLISDGLGAALGEGAVQLSAPVRKVQWSDDGAVVECDAGSWRVRNVVCAIPPMMINEIQFDPPLPPNRRRLNQRFLSGRYSKLIFCYDRPFWRDENWNGNVVATDGTITAIYDLGDENTECGVLGILFGGHACVDLDAMPPEARVSFVTDIIARCFGDKARSPLEVHQKSWVEDSAACGGPSHYLIPGVWSQERENLRAACGPIHWAGSHMSRSYRGYLEGAVRSGERAAADILAGF